MVYTARKKTVVFRKRGRLALSMKNPNASKQLHPLCVDLDGTLIHTDLLIESLLLLIKRNPLYIFCLPFWLLGGRAAFKEEIAKRVSLNAAYLPYNSELLRWLELEKAAGRPLWLCTGSHHSLAEAVSEHLNIFEGVMATTAAENFTGETKARALTARFGERGFDYCGNEQKDLAVWKVSHGGIVVNADKSLEERVRAIIDVKAVFPRKTGKKAKALLAAVRMPQWVKNVLIFVPLIAAHHATDIPALKDTVIAFWSFCFCASAVYLLNDMLDLEADRQHPSKALRPFAAGNLPLITGFVLMPSLLAASFVLAVSFLTVEFLLVLCSYYLLTVAYSFALKRLPIVDTLCLACLYTLRIVAGAAAAGVPLSFWLLLFSVFFFLSLAWVKRCTELEAIQRNGREHAAGRGYKADDLPLLKAFGIVAGYLSILVLALYIDSPAVTALYRHPQIIWFICILMLYWISRIWLKTHQGKMHDDPVIFALKDKTSLVTGLLAFLTMLAAI